VQFLCILTPWGISLVGDSPYFYTLFPKIQTYAAGLLQSKKILQTKSNVRSFFSKKNLFFLATKGRAGTARGTKVNKNPLPFLI
jgi:hypothetical protein